MIVKSFLMLKLIIVLPLILIVDYVLMVILGCASCLFGIGDDFYCGPYCIIGKIILVVSALLFGFLIYPDIARIFREKKYGKATKEPENK